MTAADRQAKLWRREILIVAAALLVITVVGWLQVRSFSAQVRDASVEACQRNNAVRIVIAQSLRDAIRSASQRGRAAQVEGDRIQASVIFETVEGLQDRLFDLVGKAETAALRCEEDYPP